MTIVDTAAHVVRKLPTSLVGLVPPVYRPVVEYGVVGLLGVTALSKLAVLVRDDYRRTRIAYLEARARGEARYKYEQYWREHGVGA